MPALSLVPSKYNLNVLTDDEVLESGDFLSAMLKHVVGGGTLQSFYRTVSKAEVGKGYICLTRLRLTLSVGDVDSVGVVALSNAYQRARAGFMESKFDELMDMYDNDAIVADPRLATAYKGKSANIMWCLSKMKPDTYGDKLTVEQSIDVTIVDRLQAGRERAALIDVESKT